MAARLLTWRDINPFNRGLTTSAQIPAATESGGWAGLDAEPGRLYSQVEACSSATGRLSSTLPVGERPPARSHVDRHAPRSMAHAYIAGTGFTTVSVLLRRIDCRG